MEEALQWRLEAHYKREKEFSNELTLRVVRQQRAFEVLSSETSAEF